MTGIDPTRNVVLTGFMGTGKTTVGRRLARQLGFEFVDTDALIEDRHGPIATIFSELGEAAFRSIEREVAADLADRENLVVATGGRMMLDPANIVSLSRHGRVFCLVASPEHILQRVMTDSSRIKRPLLAVADPRRQVIELLDERGPGYRRFTQISTERRSPGEIAGEIGSLVRSEPDRAALGDPDREVIVGAAVLPLVRELCRIVGPFVIVADEPSAENYLASCPDRDAEVIVSPDPDPTSSEAVERIRRALANVGADHPTTLMSLGGTQVGTIVASVAATDASVIALIHCPTDRSGVIAAITNVASADARLSRTILVDVATLQSLDQEPAAALITDVQEMVADIAQRQVSSGPASVDPKSYGERFTDARGSQRERD